MKQRQSKRLHRALAKRRANGHAIYCVPSALIGSHTQMEVHIFTELVGIQMLLMNTLEPLLRGDKIAPEQLETSFAKSRQPRPRRRRNSSPSAAKTRRNSHAYRPTMGPQGVDHLAATRLLSTPTARSFSRRRHRILLIYVRFPFGLSPLEQYYLPYYLRTEITGLHAPHEHLSAALRLRWKIAVADRARRRRCNQARHRK